MAEQRISAKEVIRDIKSGMSSSQLQQKYRLSDKGLESLFRKLVDKNLLDPAEVPGFRPEPRKTKRDTLDRAVPPESTASGPSGVDPRMARDVVADVVAGRHDNEIMMKHGLSPGQWKRLQEDLIAAGYLSSQDLESRAPKKTKLCPFCRAEIPEDSAQCKHCGEMVDAPPRSQHEPVHPGVRSFRTEKEADEEDRYCPWEDARGEGIISAYLATAPRILFSPSSFFAQLPRSGGFVWPALFGVVSMLVSVLFISLWYQLFAGGGFFGLFGMMFLLSIVFALALVSIPIGLLIWSAIVHLCLLVFQGAKNGFEATFRVFSYASVTSVFGAVPVVGTIASLYGIYLGIVGLREAHDTSTGKSAGAVLAPFGLVMVLVLVMALPALLSPKARHRVATKQPHFSMEYAGEPLPSDLCDAINTYVQRVDSAATMDLNAAQAEVKAALNDVQSSLREHESHPNIAEIRQKVTVFGFAQLAQLAFKEKFGSSKSMRIPGGEIEKVRNAIQALCPS